MRKSRNFIAHDGSVMGNVAAADFDQIVEIACDHITFLDFWNGLHRVIEFSKRCFFGVRQSDLDIGDMGQAECQRR